MAAAAPDEPLVVWHESMSAYDFGPAHPLTPRRFGPGIDLLRSFGATRFRTPHVASDEELGRLHDDAYIRSVRATSVDPGRALAAGVGTGDVPAFAGMHDAAALVAGGSIDAAAEIVAERAMHAFAPGGGLHHAMADRASGFCIYNDVALAVAVARDAGHRVLYVDLDVHHGDGTQSLFWDDPAVLTLSVHESGRSLFPGTGTIDERGGPGAHGTAVNIPLDAGAGDMTWWPVVEAAVGKLAAAFEPTFLVSQHGCDTHMNDPLAHLRLTTASYARACTLLDRIAHERCDGRWLATGGGGYDAYRVVPRSWAIVWLAQAHRPLPPETPQSWRERWADAAADHGQAPIPVDLIDAPGTVEPDSPGSVAAMRAIGQASVAAATDSLEPG